MLSFMYCAETCFALPPSAKNASFLKEQQPVYALLRGHASETGPARIRKICLFGQNYFSMIQVSQGPLSFMQ